MRAAPRASARVRTDTVPGPESRRLIAQAAAQEGPAVARQPSIAWRRAAGVHVEDADGNVFLDFSSSVLVANVGHCHPRVVQAIREQADELLHTYNFVNHWRTELGRRLLELTAACGFDRVFIGSTGAEMVELALKLARYASARSGTLVLDGGYHGKTLAATALGGRPESLAGLGELLPGIVRLPFPSADRPDSPQLERAALARLQELERDGTAAGIGAVLIEAVQGNAGQRSASPAFLQALQAFARRHDAVFVIDEVQSAFGRTGTLFAYEQFGLSPDLVVAGKGLSSSLPLTVMLGRSRVFDAAPARTLSSTHGGNPVVCRAACAVLDVIADARLLENASEVGAALLAGLRDAVAACGLNAEVRGIGLMIGVELRDEHGEPDSACARAVVHAAISRGLLLLAPIGLHKNVIRVSPPLVLSEQQAREGVALLAEAFAEVA
ncbi:MAG TPA: aspartate aminotransferase family protein [Solirubrobacteraceae bacterium]|nr:aspartate aminotransferase family protein [Solirubrobacteraceae bacterium]